LQNPELSEENFKYKAISEDETQRRARERVSEGREEALEYIKNKEDWDGTDTDTAFELLRLERAEAAEKGDWVRVGEIARLIQKRATKAGQEIQAHAKYTRTAEKVIVEAAEQIENSSLISKEDIELLRELANRFVNDEGELDAARMDKVMTEILKEEPKVRRRRVRKVFRELIAARKKDMGKRDFLMETEEILSSHMEDTVKAQEIMKTVSGAADLIYSIKEDGEAAKDKLIELIKRQAAIRGHKISRANEKRILGEDFEFLYETAEKQLRAITEDYIPRLLGQKVSTVQSLGQLLQLPTYQTNIISNRAFGFADKQTANAFGIAFDRIISLITKQKTVRYENTFGHGISKAGEKAKNRAKINAALDIKSGEQGRYGTGTTRTFKSDESRWKVTKLLSNAEKLLAYELNVPDEAQKGRIKRAVTESLIPLVENGHMTVEEATEIAADEARYRTFQDDNLPSKILGELKKVFNHFFGTKDFGAGDFVCKYTQVAGALIERTLEYSPAGYLKGIYNLGEMWRNGISPKKQRKAALAFGRGTTGTGLILISTLLSSLGIVFRDDDESDDNIRALNSAEGVIGTKINLSALGRLLSGKSTKAEKGDTLLSIDRFEPFNMFFTVGAEISKAENKSFGNIALTSITGAAKSIGDLSVMQTIDEFISLLEYSDNADQIDVASEIAIFIGESTIGSFIPSLVRRGARAFDNNYRDAYADDSELGIALRQLGSSIPGVRNTLPKKLDNFGYEKTYTDNTVMNALNALALPFEVSAYKKRDVSSELERVRKETGNTNIYPPKSAPYSIKYDGEKYVLHTEARERYQKTRGNTMYRLIFEALKNENYKELNAEQQAAILEDFKAYATDKAKEEYFKSVSVEYESDSAVYKADEALLEGTKISDFYIGKYAEDKEEKTKEEAREKARRTAIEERYGALTDEGWKNIKRAMASSQKKDEEIAAILVEYYEEDAPAYLFDMPNTSEYMTIASGVSSSTIPLGRSYNQLN
ncbi:MAG: hypothetical protein IJO61_00770, partial [Oscillospiraceae bacterium]|nr:hypothetical protein [Oscillospiraceae bacterium]